MKIIRTMKKLSFIIIIISITFGACQNDYPDLEEGVYAEFKTNKGVFVAKLYNEATPITVANFVDLAEGNNDMVDSIYKGKKYFNGLIFHRVIKDFMIQGGDPLGNGSGNPGYKFPDEIVDTLKHSKKGILSMANSGPETNGSQFFIILKETPWLNGKHTVFGEIVIGQSVIDSLGMVETKKPGDVPVDTVRINEVNIIRIGDVKIASFKSEMEAIENQKKEKEARIEKVATETAVGFAPLREKAEELPSGLKIYFTEKGNGEKPKEGSKILMNYSGYLENGTLFDSNLPEIARKYGVFDHRRADSGGYEPSFSDYSKDARLIPGFREGLLMLSVGDKVTLFIPAHLGYGERGYPPQIPSNADLVFELELVEIIKPQ